MDNTTEAPDEDLLPPSQLINPAYVSVEILIVILGVIGNGLVIICFCREEKLRKRHNYHVVSLAISDLISAAVGIPCEISQGLGLPHDHYGCLAQLSTLLALCLISVYNKVGVSINRYWASVYPLSYFNIKSLKHTYCKFIFPAGKIEKSIVASEPFKILKGT
jgi:adenosine receptor A2a